MAKRQDGSLNFLNVLWRKAKHYGANRRYKSANKQRILHDHRENRPPQELEALDDRLAKEARQAINNILAKEAH